MCMLYVRFLRMCVCAIAVYPGAFCVNQVHTVTLATCAVSASNPGGGSKPGGASEDGCAVVDVEGVDGAPGLKMDGGWRLNDVLG